MIAPNDKTDDLSKVLKGSYEAPQPDRDFVKRLSVRLGEELAAVMEGRAGAVVRSRRVIRLRWGAAAAVAAVILLGVGLHLVSLRESSRERVSPDDMISHQQGETRSNLESLAAAQPPRMLARMPEPGSVHDDLRTRLYLSAFPQWADIDTRPLLTASSSTSSTLLFALPLSMRVARASAIVRCEVVGLTETDLVCKLTRVIYGRLPGQLLHVEDWVAKARLRLRAELGREPTREEVKDYALEGFKASHDVILFVDRVRKTDGVLFCRTKGISCDVPPSHPLDEHEKEIVEFIKSGAHLTPALVPGGLGPYVRSSDIVVRPRLTKIGETAAEWEVAGVVHTAPPDHGPPAAKRTSKEQAAEESTKLAGTTIKVGLDAWRLRAESIVNYRGTQQPDKPVKEGDIQKDIQKEFAGLVETELQVGREAILFLRKSSRTKETVTYGLVGTLHDDPKKKIRIDDMEKKIREMIKKGEHRANHLW